MGMIPFTLKEIADSCGGIFYGCAEDMEKCVSSVCRDSREIRQDSLFVCIKGERADGHDFAAAAYDSGALCCLAEKKLETGRPYILVPDVLTAIRQIAQRYRAKFSIPFIGIVGSVGKTTAKEMTAAVLGQKFNVLKTPENLNNELGVPLTVLSVGKKHTAAVIEMGISDFGEMSRLGQIVRPDICVFTTIGYCHLEALGDLNGVMRAKGEVFQYMGKNAAAVLNGDDEILRSYDPKMEKITFGLSSGCDVTAKDIRNRGFDGIDFSLCINGRTASAHINAFGSHVVSAALAAAAVGNKLGMDISDIAAGIEKYKTVGSRADVIKAGKITIISDCYNSNPHSLKAALTSLSDVPGRRVAILGDMLELGETSDKLHFDSGVYAGKSCDVLMCCGNEAKHIYDGFISAKTGNQALYYTKKQDLIDDLERIIQEGDTVLVKASHGMHFEEIVSILKNLKV